MKIDDQDLLRKASQIRPLTLAMKALIRDARVQRIIAPDRPEACALDVIADQIDDLVAELEVFAMESDPTRGPGPG
jgi:hypothetical protein